MGETLNQLMQLAENYPRRGGLRRFRTANTIARCILNTFPYPAVPGYTRSRASVHAHVRSIAVIYFRRMFACPFAHENTTLA